LTNIENAKADKLIANQQNGSKILSSKPSGFFLNDVSGALRIIFPNYPQKTTGNPFPNVMYRLRITGYNYVWPTVGWTLEIAGYAYSLANMWTSCNVTSPTRNVPFDKVRFWSDGNRYGIMIGDISSIWQYPHIIIDQISVRDPYGALSNIQDFEFDFVDTEAGLIFSGDTFYANSEPQNTILHPTWYPLPLINGATTDLAAPLNYCKVNGVVYIIGKVMLNTLAVINIGTMPTGYRSTNWVSDIATNGNDVYDASKKGREFYINAETGNIIFHAGDAMTLALDDSLYINVSYPAEG
jgi:hypothetical protein